nr:hypothetical protein [Bacteroidetes bacterium endosymbiont of Geopemphigus sp.]
MKKIKALIDAGADVNPRDHIIYLSVGLNREGRKEVLGNERSNAMFNGTKLKRFLSF